MSTFAIARLAMGLFVLLAATSAGARIWHVEVDGSGDYSDIQPAVEAAAPGDTISIGPGRFATFRTIEFPPWSVSTIVGVKKSGLRITGSGCDRTFLGPAGKTDAMSQVFYSDGGHDVAIENMTIENTDLGINWANGHLLIRSCVFIGGDRGASIVVDKVEAIVRDCTFEQPNSTGSIVVYHTKRHPDSCLIDNCTIRGGATGVEVMPWAEDVVIRNTTIEDAQSGIVFQAESKGRVENCAVVNSSFASAWVMSGATVDFANTALTGGTRGLEIDGGIVTARSLVISGTTASALVVNLGGRASIHGSDFLPASGWAFYSEYYDEPVTAIDLTDNFWGTSDAESIRASICDNRCYPPVACKVVFEPFAGGPVPTDVTSWGEVKVMFR
ncbi:MAG: right-handed parallel beta-helix repeat-containing protein [bacterium]|nr:right-handed parallel beta-helix repeat-containing protein [bacterium]